MGTIVYSENRFCLVKEEKGHEAEDFLPFFQDMDLILVEGLKDSHYAKIEVMRRDVSKKAVCRKETVQISGRIHGPDLMQSLCQTVRCMIFMRSTLLWKSF